MESKICSQCNIETFFTENFQNAKPVTSNEV